MIIRRSKRRRNFTIIGNEVFECGLTAEAVGVLAYLISRPDNWKVSLEQLRKQFGCGRERMQRIIRELIDARFVRRQCVRNPETHQFTGTEYTVFDEIQAIANEDEDPVETPAIPPQSENPPTGEPQSGKPQSENPTVVISTEKTNTQPKSPIPEIPGKAPVINDEQAREGTDGEGSSGCAVSFEAFESVWPWDPADDRTGARRIFVKLPQLERRSAVAGIAAFAAWMGSSGGRRAQAKMYLRRGLWKNQSDPQADSDRKCSDLVFVTRDSTAWAGCVERFRREHEGRSPTPRQKAGIGPFGWYFPADWLETSDDRVEARHGLEAA